jgi:hypothetical protein
MKTEQHKAIQPLAEAFGLLLYLQHKKDVRDALTLIDQALKLLEKENA